MTGNAANPMTGSGMQQARVLPSGGSRRGGVKPRGRNGIPRQAASGPNRVDSNGDSGEWTLGRHAGGGESRHPSFAGPRRPQGLQGPLTTRVVSARRSVCRTNPRRGGRIPTRATGEHSEGEPRPEGPLVVSRPSGREAAARHRRNTSKTRRVTGKVMEAAGKTNDPLRRPRGRRTSHLTMIGPRQAL
jgi:hypothetical protein